MDKITLQATLEGYFTWFHRHPELGLAEHKTTARIRELLLGAGVEILDTPLKTGLIAQIRGRPGGPVTALRADIDALPIAEATGLDYASEHPGCMHACGHDFHLTALLGAALLLREEAETLAGTVKLLFQPAEEGAGGAQAVLDTGFLDDVEEIYGLHVMATLAPGVIALSPGATYATVGRFRILVKGRGGHAAEPHHSKDPIVAAARIINQAQTIISRGTSPFDPAVLSITRVLAGSTWNVIPPEALLEGTFRAFSPEKLTHIAESLGKICRGLEESDGIAIDYTWRIVTYSTNNDPVLTEWVAETAKKLDLSVVPYPPTMGGEDFALYQQRIPGVFLNIGVGSPQELHNPGFIANPAPLATAAELLAALGKGSVARLAQNPPSLGSG
ncbi:amidohydrolase [Treponema sp. TIM-1]|uniref:M20 metallopeptidase family protein n=1 Tax=Treponema sp. TIM-1 TaxID=2898417 RepID=UPI00398026F9